MEKAQYTIENHRLRVHESADGIQDFSKVEVQIQSQDEWETVQTYDLPVAAPQKWEWLEIEIVHSGEASHFVLTNHVTNTTLNPMPFEVAVNENWSFGDVGEARKGGIGIIDIRGSRTVQVDFNFSQKAVFIRYDSSGYLQVASPAVTVTIQNS